MKARRSEVCESRVAVFLTMAAGAGLPDPLGRAVALESRVQNAGCPYWFGSVAANRHDPDYQRAFYEWALGSMASFRPETAARWRWVWETGRDVRVGRTREEQAAHRARQRRARLQSIVESTAHPSPGAQRRRS